ncbi:MAG: terpene cyclase/mutase family protein [Planctomycetaceae bacterium]
MALHEDRMSLGINRLGSRLGTTADPESRDDAGDVATSPDTFADAVREAVALTRDWLLDRQHPDGYWVGELEGDTILESEYVLLLTWIGQEKSATVQRLAAHIAKMQLPAGGWSLFPGGPLEVSGSVKAYWTLKIAGYDIHSEPMTRARNAIRAAGGAERVNSFTRYYLALLGIIEYRQCPAVPPELMFIPHWAPFNIYEMSAWSRTILVPLSLLWAYQPSRELPPDHKIDELFLKSPAELPVNMPPSTQLDAMKRRARLPWERIFQTIDRVWKLAETFRIKPLRAAAIRRAADWMTSRFVDSDGLGAIFPPIIWSVVALKCLGHGDDSPAVQAQLRELEKLGLDDDDGALRLQPCKSPVWDSAIALIALREAEVPPEHPRLRKAIDWLLSKEVRTTGDWSVHNPQLEPGGWFFEFNNRFYPDVDDTTMVTMALAACLPEDDQGRRTTAIIGTGPKGHTSQPDLRGVVSGRTSDPLTAVEDIESMQPILAALQRGARWMLGMQCANGGWGAFDRDNTRELLTRVPFADHNAMIDPPTADITARVLEMFGRLGFDPDHPALQRALDFVWKEQEQDHCWYGRWGVNYIYGTWQVLVGLKEIGISPTDRRMRSGAQWLKDTQQASGGWGESANSYDHPELRGQGPATASQTAWAVMGLIAAGEVHSPAVRRGIAYLLSNQQADGAWEEDWFTGTGFPRVFYLKYHLYRIYFPLMALARYARLSARS